MASKYPVSFKITIKSNFSIDDENPNNWKPAYKPGQIIFVEDEGKIYLDFHTKRVCYSGLGSGSSSGLNYIGISSTDPETGNVTIDGNLHTPSLNDMVVYGTKEYLYRKGQVDGKSITKWFELGDEDDTIEWEDDTTIQ